LNHDEAKLQAKAVALIRDAGGVVLSDSCSRGSPDIVALVEGKVLALELKTPGGRPSEAQEVRMRELREAGVCADYARDEGHVRWAVDRLRVESSA